MTGFQTAPGMVSKWWMRPRPRFCREIPHQSKIYTESNHSDFWQIFGDLTSMQTLAIYRRLLIRTDCVAHCNRCGGKRQGNKETAGVA
jgi:hypothetical protein